MAGRMINGAAALAELVRPLGDIDEPGVQRVLPVAPELSGLLPGRGLRRGSTVAVGQSPVWPQRAGRSPNRLQSGSSQTDSPRAVLPPVRPGAVRPGAVQPQTVQPQTVQPQTVQPQTVQPQAVSSPAGSLPVRPGMVQAPADLPLAHPGTVQPPGGSSSARLEAVQDPGVGQSPTGSSRGVLASGVGRLRMGGPAGGGMLDSSAAVAGGGTSLLLALLSAASRAGSWCAVVGIPALGSLAAAESGIALDRLALVPYPGPEWPTVVAALIDGVDVVVVAVPGPVAPTIASRLVARARQRGCVLMPVGSWAGADVSLQVTRGAWEGLGAGQGRLRRREVTVTARGRGAAARPKEITVWMPGITIPPPIPPAPPRPTRTLPPSPVHKAPLVGPIASTASAAVTSSDPGRAALAAGLSGRVALALPGDVARGVTGDVARDAHGSANRAGSGDRGSVSAPRGRGVLAVVRFA
jgi:hypothetical protein